MPRPRVYVETTLPSFYHDERSSADVVARRQWTRQWWQRALAENELVTSPAVIRELIGTIPQRAEVRFLNCRC